MPMSNKSNRRPLHERLDELPKRVRGALEREPMVRSNTTITLSRPEEIAAASVGILIMKRLAEIGQTRIFPSAVEATAERLTSPLTAEEMMRLEVEAYEVVDWLLGEDPGVSKPPLPVAVRTSNGILYDPNASAVELLNRAIEEDFDVWIDYFSKKRGEMNTRRVTPKKIEAETWLKAYCHSRRQERHFRLSRITRCVPVGGRAARGNDMQPAPAVEPGPSPVQQSLLHD